MLAIVAERLIAADPTGTALLLAAPAAAELWPGAELLGTEHGDHVRVALTAPNALATRDVLVHPDAPVRTPTAFLIRFSVTTSGVPAMHGELTLEYATAADSAASATRARLHLDLPNDGCDVQGLDVFLQLAAEQFLDALASAAEGRSRAA